MKTGQKTVISQVVIKAPSRGTSDVGGWRSALRSADIGRIKQLFDLFEDLRLDGRLSDAYDKRVQAVTNSPLTFTNADGEEVDAITTLMDTPSFEELLISIMDRLFWGRSAVEFDFSNGGFEVFDIPKKHIDIAGRQILINDTDTSGIPYDGDDNILVLGKQRDFGLYLKTAPYVIWKRGGFGDYAQWLEIFGMPQRIGKYSAYDEESRKLLEKALSQAGSAPWCVVPKETDIETVNNTGSGSSGTSYDEFRKACNEEMTITILGQTLTTVQGDKGARSLGEVHKQVEEGKNRSDMRYVQRILNKFFLPILERRGYPVAGGRFVFPDATEQLSVDDIVSLSGIIDIPADYVHKKYSIPVPKDGDIIAGKKKQEAIPPVVDDQSGQGTDDKPVDDKKKTTDKADLDDRGLFQRFLDFFAGAPALPGATLTGDRLTLTDGDINDIVIREVDGKRRFIPALYQYLSDDLIQAMDITRLDLIDMAIEYGYESDAYITAMEMNVFRFSAAKTLAEITELNKLYRESTSFSDFQKKARAVTDTFNKKWQRTEYETANLICSSTSNYQRLIKKTDLFPYWEYKTVGDDKVRPEHARLHGIILPWDDERWAKIWPPNGWKCRCYIVPRMVSDVEGVDIEENRRIVDEFFETSEWKMSVGSGFGVNRALSSELFREDQQYIRKFPQKASKLLRDINHKTYNLRGLEQLQDDALSPMPSYQGDIADVVKNLHTENGKTFVNDYKGRLVGFDAETGDKSSITGAIDTVSAPDEVWINATDKSLSSYTFVRAYADDVMVVIAEIADGKVYTVSKWMALGADAKKKSRMYRSGLLIRKRTQTEAL